MEGGLVPVSKEAMVKINVRLPQYVVDYFRQYTNYTGAVEPLSLNTLTSKRRTMMSRET